MSRTEELTNIDNIALTATISYMYEKDNVILHFEADPEDDVVRANHVTWTEKRPAEGTKLSIEVVSCTEISLKKMSKTR